MATYLCPYCGTKCTFDEEKPGLVADCATCEKVSNFVKVDGRDSGTAQSEAKDNKTSKQ